MLTWAYCWMLRRQPNALECEGHRDGCLSLVGLFIVVCGDASIVADLFKIVELML